jgi:hypothetical protein
MTEAGKPKDTDRKIKALQKIVDRYKMLDGQFCHCGLPAIKKIGDTYLCYRHNAVSPSFDRRGVRKGRFSGKSQTPFGGYEDK